MVVRVSASFVLFLAGLIVALLTVAPNADANVPPNAPELVSPADGAVVTASTFTMTWATAIDPDGGVIGYGAKAVLDGQWYQCYVPAPSTSCSVVLPAYGSGYWSVHSDDGSSVTTESASRAFSFANPTPPPPPPPAPTPPPPLTCGVTQNGGDLLTAEFYAAGGVSGTYSWTSAGSPSTGTGTLYATTFPDYGSFTVTVQRGAVTAQCSIYFPPPPFYCVVTAKSGTTATFTGYGGGAWYTWSSGGNPSTASGRTYSATFPTYGSWTATIHTPDTGGGTVDATCSVSLVAPPPPPPPMPPEAPDIWVTQATPTSFLVEWNDDVRWGAPSNGYMWCVEWATTLAEVADSDDFLCEHEQQWQNVDFEQLVLTASAETQCFRVTLWDGNGFGPPSETVCVQVRHAPGPANGAQASAGVGEISVSWAPPADNGHASAVAYSLRRYEVGVGWGNLHPVSGLSYIDEDVVVGHQYKYAIYGRNEWGTSTPAYTLFVVPFSVPGTPTVYAEPGVARGSIKVLWSAPADGYSPITGYQILREGGNEITTVGPAALSQVMQYGPDGRTGSYAVRAINSAGPGPYSSFAAARTLPAVGHVNSGVTPPSCLPSCDVAPGYASEVTIATDFDSGLPTSEFTVNWALFNKHYGALDAAGNPYDSYWVRLHLNLDHAFSETYSGAPVSVGELQRKGVDGQWMHLSQANVAGTLMLHQETQATAAWFDLAGLTANVRLTADDLGVPPVGSYEQTSTDFRLVWSPAWPGGPLWEGELLEAQIQLVAAPVIFVNGWDKAGFKQRDAFEQYPGWRDDFSDYLVDQAFELTGQDPWAWSWSTSVGTDLALYGYIYNVKEDARLASLPLASLLTDNLIVVDGAPSWGSILSSSDGPRDYRGQSNIQAWSFGGLVSRSAIELHLWEAGLSPENYVAGLTTMGSPFFGSGLARRNMDANEWLCEEFPQDVCKDDRYYWNSDYSQALATGSSGRYSYRPWSSPAVVRTPLLGHIDRLNVKADLEIQKVRMPAGFEHLWEDSSGSHPNPFLQDCRPVDGACTRFDNLFASLTRRGPVPYNLIGINSRFCYLGTWYCVDQGDTVVPQRSATLGLGGMGACHVAIDEGIRQQSFTGNFYSGGVSLSALPWTHSGMHRNENVRAASWSFLVGTSACNASDEIPDLAFDAFSTPTDAWPVTRSEEMRFDDALPGRFVGRISLAEGAAVDIVFGNASIDLSGLAIVGPSGVVSSFPTNTTTVTWSTETNTSTSVAVVHVFMEHPDDGNWSILLPAATRDNLATWPQMTYWTNHTTDDRTDSYVPLGDPTHFAVDVKNAGFPLSGARVWVRIFSPFGNLTTVVDLNDDGRYGDVVAADGRYEAVRFLTVPATYSYDLFVAIDNATRSLHGETIVHVEPDGWLATCPTRLLGSNDGFVASMLERSPDATLECAVGTDVSDTGPTERPLPACSAGPELFLNYTGPVVADVCIKAFGTTVCLSGNIATLQIVTSECLLAAAPLSDRCAPPYPPTPWASPPSPDVCVRAANLMACTGTALNTTSSFDGSTCVVVQKRNAEICHSESVPPPGWNGMNCVSIVRWGKSIDACYSAVIGPPPGLSVCAQVDGQTVAPEGCVVASPHPASTTPNSACLGARPIAGCVSAKVVGPRPAPSAHRKPCVPP